MKPGIIIPSSTLQTTLTVPLEKRFVETVTAFTETSASALGLGLTEARRLRLSSEEVFAYLADRAGPGRVIRLETVSGGYFVQLTCRFEASGFNPRALNLTAVVDTEDESSLKEMGLLIASRMVELFNLKEESKGQLSLTLVKEKAYPEPEGPEPDPPPALQQFRVRHAEPDDLVLLSRYLPSQHAPSSYPQAFRLPGKVIDMAGSGAYHWVVGLDEEGHMGGGLAWRFVTPRTAECFGPYLMNQPRDSPLAGALVEACLSGLAKTDAVGLICRYATGDLPAEYFEHVGTTTLVDPASGTSQSRPAFHRQLREDPGSRVWCVPGLEEFLRSHYDRLFFARELVSARDHGQTRPTHSVLSAAFERGAGRVTLRPVWDGEDMGENVRQHVRVLKAEGLVNLFFELDLAKVRDVLIASLILEQGFEPRVILPYAGVGDVLLLQHAG